jgi:hypothetical protein
LTVKIGNGGTIEVEANGWAVEVEVTGAHEYEHDSRGLKEPDHVLLLLTAQEARALAEELRACASVTEINPFGSAGSG